MEWIEKRVLKGLTLNIQIGDGCENIYAWQESTAAAYPCGPMGRFFLWWQVQVASEELKKQHRKWNKLLIGSPCHGAPGLRGHVNKGEKEG